MTSLNRSDDNDLLIALGHPLRRRILRRMSDEKAISPRELATLLREPLSNVAYHVRVLARCEAATLAATRPRRGSMQHFYRRTIEAPWARQVLEQEESSSAEPAAEEPGPGESSARRRLSRPRGGGVDRTEDNWSTEAEDLATEAVVLRHVLDVHPVLLTLPELVREIGGESAGFATATGSSARWSSSAASASSTTTATCCCRPGRRCASATCSTADHQVAELAAQAVAELGGGGHRGGVVLGVGADQDDARSPGRRRAGPRPPAPGPRRRPAPPPRPRPWPARRR